MLAGVSATWLTYLEQGRDVSPSEQVLTALATALGLGGAERDHLLALAGGTAATGPVGRTASTTGPGAETLVGTIAAPAYVTDAAQDLLAVNAAALELFTGTADGDGDGVDWRPANLAVWVLTHPAAPTVLLDWEVVARDVLARLRAAAARHPGDPRFPDLVTHLRASSAQADQWWRRYEVAGPHGGTKRVLHPRRGVLTMAHTALVVADRPEHTLVVYVEASPSDLTPAGRPPAPRPSP